MTGIIGARGGVAARVRVCRLLGAGAACIALLAPGATVAHAELSFSTTFGGQGAGDGQLAAPQGIGVDQTTLNPTSGDVYTADTGNARVEQFDSAGGFVRAWGWGVADGASSFQVCTSACRSGVPGAGAGQFSSPTSVAVDSSSDSSQGDVYVGDSANKVVDKFSPSGSLLATLTGSSPSTPFSSVTGIAVNENGDLWVVDGSASIVYEFDSEGALLSQFASTYESQAIAADASENLYLSLANYGYTERWTPAARAAGPGNGVDVETNAGTGLAVDLSTNDLYVDLGASINEFEADGRSLGSFGSGWLSQGAQMAYNPSVALPGAGGLGALYVADQGGNDVAVFVPPGPAAPVLVPNTESATNITATAATLQATIDANGLDTKYFFEYGPTTAYGTKSPIPPGTDIGANYPAAAAAVELSGLTAGTTYHFRVVASNSLGTTAGPDATFTTETPQVPAVESEGVASITPAKATLQATINPEFADTHYVFEYGPTAAYGTRVPLPPGTDIGESNSGQSASVELAGLAPSATYHFRVVATNSVGSTDGPDEQFTTSPAVGVDSVFVTNVTSIAANLGARINPENVETHYRFEYGPTPSYGVDAPIPDGVIKAAEGDQSVAVDIQGLRPSTKYYFRVVATNLFGTAMGSAQSFTTYPPSEAFSLPDNRVYELVSPPGKDGDVGGGQGFLKPPASAYGQSSVNGSAITYASAASFGDAQSAELATQYLSTRGPSGWTTHAISPPATPTQIELRLEPFDLFTPELTAWVFSWKNPSLTQGAPPTIENLYLGEAGAGAYQLIDDGTPANPGGESYEVVAVGASSDLRHVVFEADEALTPGAPAGAWSLYEWTPGAPLRLVSVLPGPGEVAAPSGRGPGGQINRPPNLVSSDGSRIFWIDGSEQLYVREDGASTVQLNASQRTPSLGDGTARFMAATPDGSRVFFIDETALTNATGDNGGLYEYNFAGDRLTDLTPDAGGSPGVEGVLGTSEDGASVYFVASASLPSKAVPGAGQPSAGGHNLYLARDGALTFIATLSSEDSDDWTESFNERTAEVAPDGGNLAFVSKASLTGYVNTDLNTSESDAEVFLYEAGAEALRCVSCNPSGEPPIGPASVPTARGTEHLPRYLSEDGQRLFFDSDDELLPAASNGKQNVYEYENGAIYLISAGTSNEDSTLVDTSANGDNVFFTTRSQLTPGDQDENSDMYDARVDGGFPATVSPAPCSGEECRGPVSAPPAPATIVTEETHGAETTPAQPADPAVSKHKAKKPKKHKAGAQHSARKARRSRATRGGRRVGHQRQAARHSLRRTAGHSSRVNDPAAGGER